MVRPTAAATATTPGSTRASRTTSCRTRSGERGSRPTTAPASSVARPALRGLALLALAACGARTPLGTEEGSRDAGSDATVDGSFPCTESVEVPGGAFVMGREAPIPPWLVYDEANPIPCWFYSARETDVPAHEVRVSMFLMQRTEATAGCYAECVRDGACTGLEVELQGLPDDLLTNEEHALLPVYG